MRYSKSITDRVTQDVVSELVEDGYTADLFTVATDCVCDSCLYRDADSGMYFPCSKCDWNEG